VHFAFGSSAVVGANLTGARSAAAYMRLHADAAVELVGHTDPIGWDADNDALGLRRAREVEQVLVSGGVEPSRVSASTARRAPARDGGRQALQPGSPHRVHLAQRPRHSSRRRLRARRGEPSRGGAGPAALRRGYPGVTRFVPRPVEERGGPGNAPLPDWHWGRLDGPTRAAVDGWIRGKAGTDVNAQIEGMSLDDIVEHVKEGPVDQDVTIRPRPIIQELVKDFLEAPTAMLGDLAGEPAGP
jgi:OmpA family